MQAGGLTEAELIAGVERGVYVETVLVHPARRPAGGHHHRRQPGRLLPHRGRRARPAGRHRSIHPVDPRFPRHRRRCRRYRLRSQPVMNVWNGSVSAPAVRGHGFRFGARPGVGDAGAGLVVSVRTNAEQVVAQTLCGEVWPPLADRHAYRVDADGRPFILPGMGGVTLDVHCGDPATGYATDHLEPGLSVRHPDPGANMALQFLSCVGNLVTVRSGPAAGATGRVIGQHAYVLVDMPGSDMREVNTGDQVLVHAHGQGLTAAGPPGHHGQEPRPRARRGAPVADLGRRPAAGRRRRAACPRTQSVPGRACSPSSPTPT